MVCLFFIFISVNWFISSIIQHNTFSGLFTNEEWKKLPLAKSSTAFLQDFHHDPSILDYKPQHVAIAAINLALQVCISLHVSYFRFQNILYIICLKSCKGKFVLQYKNSNIGI